MRPAELAKESLIGYEPDAPFGLLLREIFGSENDQPDMSIEVEQAHVARALAQAGAGIALVDAMTVFGQTWPNIAVVPVKTKVNASVQIFHVQTEPLSRLSLNFVEALMAMMEQ